MVGMRRIITINPDNIDLGNTLEDAIRNGNITVVSSLPTSIEVAGPDLISTISSTPIDYNNISLPYPPYHHYL